MTDPRSLADWLEFIAQAHPCEIDMGLERVQLVYDAMRLETKARQIVVVAGTNGKGSTIALIETGLLALEKTVGTYTSPHIQSYNERVKINGCLVADHQLASAFTRVENARQMVRDATNSAIPLTYFEFGTLAALDILFQQNLDVILLEVGLGGRLDAVNIVDADLTIITSIGLDHTDWLGNSLDAIGLEKAGIMRSGVLALLGENMPGSVDQHAANLGAPTLSVDQDFSRTSTGVALSDTRRTADNRQARHYSGFPDLCLPTNNILLALQALKLLSNRLPHSFFDYGCVMTAFEAFSLSGRLEKLPGHNVYFDVGHNPHAATFLRGFLQTRKNKGDTIHAVYSSLADKDVNSVVAILSPVVDCWFIAPLNQPRALDRKSLESAVGTQVKNMLSFASIPEALHQSLIAPSGQRMLTLAFGSFHLVEAAKAYFEDL